MEELKRICSEAERDKNYEWMNFPDEMRESQSTVSQLTFQIQELQDRVNFLNDSSELIDPESASSSGSFHVSSHPSIPS